MTILVFGSKGQVASELKNFKNIIYLNQNEANFLDPESVYAAIHKIKPIGVINPAAYTNVDLSEQYKEKANIINGYAPKYIASACKELNIPLIHLSTDYVFDGKSTSEYFENENTNPINNYGKSKLMGENFIIKTNCKFVIIRTSWVFSKYSSNFLKKILHKLKNNEDLEIVDDQYGCPTPASKIAETCYLIMNKLLNNSNKYGLYHYAGKPNTNWFNFASSILKLTNSSSKIKPIKSDKLNFAASRPKNSRLNCDLIKKNFDIDRPNWKNELRKLVNELK